MPRPALALVALLALLLSGCLSATDGVTPAVVASAPLAALAEDPLGDAQEAPASVVLACWAVGCADEPALRQHAEAVAFPDLAGVRVHGAQEGMLLVDVLLGPMSSTLAELERGDGLHRVVGISTCFAMDDATPCVDTLLAPGTDGPIVESYLLHVDEACNEWHACATSVATTPLFGEAGALRLEVPLAALPGARLHEVSASARVQFFEPTLPATHAAFTLYVPGDHKHEHWGPYSFVDVVDTLDAQRVDVALPEEAAWPSGSDVVLSSGPGTNWGGGSPQDAPRYDLRAIRFEETQDALVLRIDTGGWESDPIESAHVVAIFGTEGGEVYEAGLLREGGETYGYVGHCITYPCAGMFVRTPRGHDHGGWQERLPIAFPDGVIEVAIPWEHLADIQAGERLNFALGITMYADAAVYFGDYGDAIHGDVHKMSLLDFVVGAQPYVFRIGAGAHEAGHEH